MRPMHRSRIAAFALAALATALVAPAARAGEGPPLTVDASAARHAIAEEIYGMNTFGTDPKEWAFRAEVKTPVHRFGGDAATRYDWKVDGSNAGLDWFYMAGSGNKTPTPNKTIDDLVAQAKAYGAHVLMTIPIIPYLNKATDWDCTYRKSLFGNQDSYNPYVHPSGDQCGNGQLASKDLPPLSLDQIHRLHIDNSPDFAKEWMTHLSTSGEAGATGTIRFYDLDNEPGGWGNTHRDIVPGGRPYAGADGITALGLKYAEAVKSVDPSAQILGPVDFGYPVYKEAAAYLDAFRDAEKSKGKRLLDYLDEHYYPASVPANVDDAGDATTQQARLRATRSLWDPTYVDESWIGKYNPAIRLIPWLKEVVATHYPGTKLAITEYNFGGIGTVNGALAEADVLGIFGREGLDLATMWGAPKGEQPVAYAFRLYRNYDGKGARFGETSIEGKSGDQGKLSIYAAQRTSDGALTIVLINKTDAELTSALSLAHFNAKGAASMYTYSSAKLDAIVKAADVPVTSGALRPTLAGNAMAIVIVESADPPPPPPESDGGTSFDAGIPDGSAIDDASAPPVYDDGGLVDGGLGNGDQGAASNGCGCATLGTRSSASWSWLALLSLAMASVVTARRRAR